MTTGRIGVLALQGDFAEHAEALRRLGVEPVEVRLPADLAGLDGLIIPGGESHYDRPSARRLRVARTDPVADSSWVPDLGYLCRRHNARRTGARIGQA